MQGTVSALVQGAGKGRNDTVFLPCLAKKNALATTWMTRAQDLGEIRF